VSHWLTQLGLDKYVQNFVEQEIDSVALLRTLSDADLKDMGVNTIGARRKILAAIRSLPCEEL